MKTPTLILRQTFAITAFVVLILSVNAGCSSGGDGEVIDIPATIPDVLNYEMRQGSGVSLVLSQNPQATVTSTSLTGSFNRITQAFTLNAQPEVMAVDATDFLNGLLGTEFNNYILAVNTASSWVGDGSPTTGEFDVRDGPVNRIRVSVNPNVQPGVPGVDITYSPNGDAGPHTTSSFSWVDFDSLFDDAGAEDYEKIAAFAYSMLRFMYEQGELVIFALEFIGDNDTLLEQTGRIEESCDTYPLAPSPPPSVIPGMSRFSWYDASFDNSLGAGDTFYLDFTECWDDDPNDDFDTHYQGTVNFVNYTEVESGGVLTRIGFEPGNTPGGIDFEFLKITETETTLTNIVLATDETITLTGGFSMVFTAP